jgi:wobble nucleotide-excising tRNase
LAIAQLAIDKQQRYGWVKYIYVDDPVSSLDDNNTIAIAHHLSQMLKTEGNEIKTIISTHHSLFFNVLCNELKSSQKYFLSKSGSNYVIKDTNDSPFFYHVALIQNIQQAITSDRLFTYHFNVLRTILEKAANFHGFKGFEDCLIVADDDENTLHTRMVNIFNHGSYSLFEPVEMGEDNKNHFKTIFNNFLQNYKFNEALFEAPKTGEII